MYADNAYAVIVSFGVPPKTFGNWNTGFYFQDDWRVNSRLQLNLGLRYEYNTPIKGPFNVQGDPFGPFAADGTPIFSPDCNNFGPRVGIVYDLTGDGKTVLRTGGGIMYGSPQPFYYYDLGWRC
jgi:outer membrane receptor protein involved in Fe transport